MTEIETIPLRITNLQEPVWVTCPGPDCGKEVSKLFEDDGLCWDCHEAANLKRDKDRARAERIVAVLGERGYREHTFGKLKETPGNRAQIAACQAFDPAKDNLYLWGVTGSGKTHLSDAIARKFLDFGQFVIVKNAVSLFDEFYALDFYQKRDEIESMARATVLVLDDVGAGKMTEAKIQTLYDVVDRRIRQGRNGLVFNANVPPSGLILREKNIQPDMRVTSRVSGLCKIVQTEPKDWRLR